MTDTSTVLTDQTIIVNNGLITDIGPQNTTPIPAGADVINGSGKFIIPGLADMHGHILKREDAILELVNGVTTIRNMHGEPWHISYRDSINSRQVEIFNTKIAAPNIFSSGPIMNFFSHPFFGTTPIQDQQDAINSLNQQAGIGYDFFKVYTFLTPTVFDAIENFSANSGIPFAGHGNNWLGPLAVIQSEQSSIEHFWGYLPNGVLDQQQIDLENATLAEGVWNCPTLIVRYNKERLDSLRTNEPEEIMFFCDLLNNWRNPDASPQEDANFEEFSNLLYRLYHNGGKLMLGSDNITPYAIAGFAVHKELELYVEAGLTPHQALTLATSKPHEYLEEVGYGNSAGTLEIGKKADLLILGANPLIDIENTTQIEGVLSNHNYYDENCLQALLDSLVCDSSLSTVNYEIHQHIERLRLHPNPAIRNITISGLQPNESGTLSIIDVQGRIVISTEYSPTVNISNLSSGLYLLIIESSFSGEMYYARFIKQD
jgi:hypothetical protein